MDALTISLFVVIFIATTGALYSLARVVMDFIQGDGGMTATIPPLAAGFLENGATRIFSRIGRFSLVRLGKWFPRDWQEAAWNRSRLRLVFEKAGYRHYAAVMVFFGAALVFAATGFAVGVTVLGVFPGIQSPAATFVTPAVGALMGAVLPWGFLVWRTRLRQREILDHFPDSLDLIRICLEAGLGLDTAIARVGQALEKSAPTLYDEFRMLSLELRAGAGRQLALERLAARCGLAEVRSWVAMILQAERFGSSVGESIRIHAEQIRQGRRLRAEQKSATLSTRLLFPLIFCIFPALLTVLIGPAVITVKQQFIPVIQEKS
jgi:tight adherence protein C